MFLFLLLQTRNDPSPSAMAATEPRPAPSPIARGEAPFSEPPAAEELAVNVEVADVIIALDGEKVAFEAPLGTGCNVLTGSLEVYSLAVPNTTGFSAVNNKSSIVQQVSLVLLARPPGGPTKPVLQHHLLSSGHFQVRWVSEST
jgi:hypothetical protein